MPRIHQLPPHVVNQIAAGEVIERPASVVKELVENALDAGATRIDVTLEGGGAELVRVADNGCGIAAEDLLLAIASHATSKLTDSPDLHRVGTLGFRGEALASIASVSRLTLRSRVADAPAGAELTVVGGELGPVTPTGCGPGTSIEVGQLFFNTPVRRKFLRSTQTETANCGEALTRLALANPQTHFTLRQGGRMIHELPPVTDQRERIAAFFGRELAEALYWVESVDEPIRMSGYVAHPSHSRSNARTQYLFINGRAVRDRSLQHALAEAYRGLLLTGRHPIAFLNWAMPPELVDVNVHPTKLEVRFQDGGRLYSQLLATLRTRFLSADLTHSWRPTGEETVRSPATESDEDRRLRQQVVDWAQKQVAPWFPTQGGGESSDGAASVGSLTGALRKPLELTRLDRSWPGVDRGNENTSAAPNQASPAQDNAAQALRPASDVLDGQASDLAARPLPAVQIHNRYLVTESPHGVLVIDQHALHERILYEQLKANAGAGSVERQRLLVPEPVDLTQAEAAAVLEHCEVLAELGLEVEPFGGTTVLVTSVPAMLRAANGTELLRELVDIVSGGNRAPNERDLFDSLLHSMACKAAIKAGDPLTGEEIDALLAQRHLAQDSHHCPHGRPTALELTREQLDRQFLRT